MKPVKRIILLVLGALFLWFLGHSFWIICDGLTDNKERVDLVVVLGNKVNPDGTVSERLKQRLLCAESHYKNGLADRLLVSGGFGKEGHYEAQVMKSWLVDHDIPADKIIIDNNGKDTELTVQNTLALQDSLGFKSIVVVSQYFHVTRTKMLFRKHGFKEVSSASPAYVEVRDLYSICREFPAYYLERFN